MNGLIEFLADTLVVSFLQKKPQKTHVVCGRLLLSSFNQYELDIKLFSVENDRFLICSNKNKAVERLEFWGRVGKCLNF